MIEVLFAHGHRVYDATARERRSRDLVARSCGRCGIWFTQPFGIVRGPQGQTVIVCERCKGIDEVVSA